MVRQSFELETTRVLFVRNKWRMKSTPGALVFYEKL